jgi:hypothetical protein
MDFSLGYRDSFASSTRAALANSFGTPESADQILHDLVPIKDWPM